MAQHPRLPQGLERLDELSRNLWWSWQPKARDLFRALDHRLWSQTGHNPVKQLRDIEANRLQRAAGDPSFIALYNTVISAFDAYMAGAGSWSHLASPRRPDGVVAYFSMEFAIHSSLPIYAGGLGVLAGDYCKEASDVGLPLVGVGFLYPQGYFHQRVSLDGWQQEDYAELDFAETPIEPAMSPQGGRLVVQVWLEDRPLCLAAWRVRVGRTMVYLLDTNLEENAPQDRLLSSRLYTADRDQRIQQEIALGFGGVRMLRAAGIRPAVWHANEGHAAFMMLERAGEEMLAGASFDEAVARVKATTVFTTHTPVAAGSDNFPVEHVEKYFRNYWETLGRDPRVVLTLGRQQASEHEPFSMTVLGLKLSGHRNGVSRVHGGVARRIWAGLWPGTAEEARPITHVTNGVHVPTWLAPEMAGLFDKYFDGGWLARHDDPRVWERVLDIPDEELWSIHQLLKRKLLGMIVERGRRYWRGGGMEAERIVMTGALLDADVLTIGFARRFAAYKRPTLLLRDLERLKRIVSDQAHPVQVVFAGKAHPADMPAKFLLHQVCSPARDRQFEGRLVFVEDYDMHIAHFLTQGVDVWLNNPLSPNEASGTSGIKAALNGVIHLSILDGWWHEGYSGSNGWAIRGAPEPGHAEEDQADAEALYRLLEEQVVPMYYDRDREGVPHRWASMMKEAIRSTGANFSARRMLKEYVERMYTACVGVGSGLPSPPG
jgi:starch phosphorylase